MVVEDKLELAERVLKWGHISPISPDQLGCYPFEQDDPFVIRQCPHIYFIGNQKEFKTKIIQGKIALCNALF